MMTQKMFTNLKSALTRAEKKGPEEVLAECERAFALFDELGYPDAWHRWNIAKQDAEFALSRHNWTNNWR